MSAINSYPSGQRRITQIVGSKAQAGSISNEIGVEWRQFNAAATAGQLQTVLSIAGAGVLKVAAIAPMVSTQTLRLRITLDGLVVVDRTDAVAPNFSLFGIGFPIQDFDQAASVYRVFGVSPDPNSFATSCLVEVSTSQIGGAAAGRAYFAWGTYE